MSSEQVSLWRLPPSPQIDRQTDGRRPAEAPGERSPARMFAQMEVIGPVEARPEEGVALCACALERVERRVVVAEGAEDRRHVERGYELPALAPIAQIVENLLGSRSFARRRQRAAEQPDVKRQGVPSRSPPGARTSQSIRRSWRGSAVRCRASRARTGRSDRDRAPSRALAPPSRSRPP